MQTQYEYLPARGYHGQVETNKHTESGVLTTAADIGSVVCHDNGTVTKGVKVPSSAGDLTSLKVAGVLPYRSMREPGALVAGDSYSYLKKGALYLMTEGAVTAQTSAFVRHTAGAGGTVLGALRGDADTATAVAVVGITFMETLTAAGLCRVSLDL